MAVTIEDGSIVSGANSYATRSEFIAYASSLGVTISDDATADSHLVTAAKFIDSHESSLIGRKVSKSQPLSFPRYGVFLDGFSWDHDEIPNKTKECQMALAIDVSSGVDLYNPAPELVAKKEKVPGAAEVEYFGDDKSFDTSFSSRGVSLLKELLVNSGTGLSIPAIRS